MFKSRLNQLKLLEMKLQDDKFRTAFGAFLGIVMYGQKVHAQGSSVGEAQFWALYGKLQQGLFFLGIFVSLFGLYLSLLKKEDVGKKLVIGSIGAYILSFLVPELFILARDTFSK
jgi:hypothetical protein